MRNLPRQREKIKPPIPVQLEDELFVMEQAVPAVVGGKLSMLKFAEENFRTGKERC